MEREKNREGRAAVRPYIQAFYRGNTVCFLLTLVFTLLMSPISLVISWLLGAVLDVIATGDMGALWHMAKLTAVMALVMTAVSLVYYRVKSRFIHRALAQYKDFAFSRLAEKSISAFARENTGRYLSALTNDIGSVEENYLNRSFLLINSVIEFFGALAMMFWYSWELALLAIVLSFLPVVVSIKMGGELTRREKAVSDQNENFTAKVKDLLSGFAVIKSFKAEGEASRLFAEANGRVEETKRRRRWWDGLLAAMSNDCSILVQFGVFLFGAYLAMTGRSTAGTLLMIVNLCNYVLQPIQTVPQYWAGRRAALGLMEKLAAVSGENTAPTGQPVEPVLRREIRLEQVTFGYEPDKPVLQEVSLTLEAGRKYALVGASGSGKSTLLNLLMGGGSGYRGSITVDGRELRDIDPSSLYDLMSLIGQNVFLFDDTIRRNITMFRDFPRQAVDSAVKQSGLIGLMQQRGEDYRCGENGVGLSGGERQRISIARSLLRGTPVLLLDEATAALDNQTAFAVTDAILSLEGLTRLVVTHRLDSALLERYDRIFVLRNGRLCEQGTFQELMGERGYFYSLYTVTNG